MDWDYQQTELPGPAWSPCYDYVYFRPRKKIEQKETKEDGAHTKNLTVTVTKDDELVRAKQI